MTNTFSFTVNQTHPSLAGHFINNPVAPGALIIDEIMQGLSLKMPDKTILSLVFVKFLSPIAPGSNIQVNIEHKNDSKLKFECLLDGDTMVTGQFNLGD